MEYRFYKVQFKSRTGTVAIKADFEKAVRERLCKRSFHFASRIELKEEPYGLVATSIVVVEFQHGSGFSKIALLQHDCEDKKFHVVTSLIRPGEARNQLVSQLFGINRADQYPPETMPERLDCTAFA